MVKIGAYELKPKDLFILVKGLTLLTPRNWVKGITTLEAVQLNIAEAVLYDGIQNKKPLNASVGVATMVLLPKVKTTGEFRAWFIFCGICGLNTVFDRVESFEHNFPALYQVFDSDEEVTELIGTFCQYRRASILTVAIIDLSRLNPG